MWILLLNPTKIDQFFKFIIMRSIYWDHLSSQSCKKLLELMVLDKHLIVRKMYQNTCSGPPGILGTLFSRSNRESKFVCRDHYFANPMSTSLL